VPLCVSLKLARNGPPETSAIPSLSAENRTSREQPISVANADEASKHSAVRRYPSCPLLAPNGHAAVVAICPLGAERKTCARDELFRFGPRLCENSDFELACRTSISISSMWESIVLTTSFGRRQLRKQFCAFFAQARFHTAWTLSGHDRAPRPRLF
jgi:hypothetical protein